MTTALDGKEKEGGDADHGKVVPCGCHGTGMYIDTTVVFTVDAHVGGVQMQNCTVLTFSFTYRSHYYNTSHNPYVEGEPPSESKWMQAASTSSL